MTLAREHPRQHFAFLLAEEATMIGAATYLAVLIWIATLPALAAQVGQESFGCKSLITAEQLMTLQKAADQSVYRATLRRQLGIGACRLWTAGEQVTTEDEEGDLTCFAASNQHGNCYWSKKTLLE